MSNDIEVALFDWYKEKFFDIIFCFIDFFIQLEPHEMVTGSKLEEKWSLKRLSSHSSWGCWLDQYRERLDKESG